MQELAARSAIGWVQGGRAVCCATCRIERRGAPLSSSDDRSTSCTLPTCRPRRRSASSAAAPRPWPARAAGQCSTAARRTAGGMQRSWATMRPSAVGGRQRRRPSGGRCGGRVASGAATTAGTRLHSSNRCFAHAARLQRSHISGATPYHPLAPLNRSWLGTRACPGLQARTHCRPVPTCPNSVCTAQLAIHPPPVQPGCGSALAAGQG